MRELRDYQRRFLRRIILRAALVLAAVFAVVAIAVWNALRPIRALLPAFAIAERGEGELRLHFLDVGQGDCTIVEFPDGTTLVVDAGDGSWENNNKILRYLKGLGSPDLTLVATHADADHCGGFPAILEAFGADMVYLSTQSAVAGAYHALIEAAERAGCETDVLTRYDAIVGGNAYAVCVSPYSAEAGTENDASTVLYIGYAGVNALLCADISAAREAQLVRESELSEDLFDSGEYRVRLAQTQILKAAHHGSASSSSEDWLKLTSPQTTIVSCGQGNSYGHPAQEALSRIAASGSDIFRTDEVGDIMITIYPNGTYQVETGYY